MRPGVSKSSFFFSYGRILCICYLFVYTRGLSIEIPGSTTVGNRIIAKWQGTTESKPGFGLILLDDEDNEDGGGKLMALTPSNDFDYARGAGEVEFTIKDTGRYQVVATLSNVIISGGLASTIAESNILIASRKLPAPTLSSGTPTVTTTTSATRPGIPPPVTTSSAPTPSTSNNDQTETKQSNSASLSGTTTGDDGTTSTKPTNLSTDVASRIETSSPPAGVTETSAPAQTNRAVNRLSTKAIVGIVIGGTILLLLQALGLFVFFLRRRGKAALPVFLRKTFLLPSPAPLSIDSDSDSVHYQVTTPSQLEQALISHPETLAPSHEVAPSTQNTEKDISFYVRNRGPDADAISPIASSISEALDASSARLLLLQQEASSPTADTNTEELHATITRLERQVAWFQNQLYGDDNDGEPPPAYSADALPHSPQER